MSETPKTVAVSGGFDPIHIGHLRLFQAAKALGNRLIVILNNDNWLRDKKGYVFMPEAERAEIIRGFACVDNVYITGHPPRPEDRSVTVELHAIRPDVFANGGDRNDFNVPEYKTCEELGIEMRFGVGGEKVQSSSWLVENASKPHD